VGGGVIHQEEESCTDEKRALNPTHAASGVLARNGIPARGSRFLRNKFRESVALPSTEPVDFPLARTALELGFDLPALRAPCKREPSRDLRPVQEGSRCVLVQIA